MYIDPQPGTQLGAYRILDQLGRGGMAVVYSAVHQTTGQTYAIKLLQAHAATGEVRSRFQREFRALSHLDHPNVARVFEAGFWGDRPFYVMELFPGNDLKSEIDSWKALPPGERFSLVRKILVQMASALAHIHARGLVHRDVTPSNIMLKSPGHAKLMDFGVVKEPGTDLTTAGEVVGTIAYISPEQILGDPVDERADLYSLGAVLYLMLTGRRPFHASTLAGYLEKHVNRLPRAPREVVPAVPLDLDEACMRLLAKDPAERFSSALHLFHFVEAGDAPAVDVKGGHWPRRTVGRAAEMAVLREALFRLQGGGGGVILLQGTSGTGKTRLLNDLVALARSRGVAVSRGQCLPGSHHAYSGFVRIYESLRGSDSNREPQADAATPQLGHILRRAFEAEDQSGEPPPERYAVYAAFMELVRHALPRLIILEDVHRADSGTTELTEYLVRNSLGLSNDPALYVITRWPPLENLDPWRGVVTGDTTGVAIQRILLGPLSESAVEDLLLGVIPGERAAGRLARRLHREGEGNPQFIVEMIRGLVEEKVIVIDEGGHGHLRDDIGTILKGRLPVPPSLRHALRERLSPLSPTGRKLAVIVAAARQDVDIRFLCQVTRLDMGHVLGVIDELTDAGVIRDRHVGGEERFELAEAGLREILLDEVAGKERQAIYRRIGSVMEQLWRGRLSNVADIIAYHFEQGNVPAKAYPYLLRAGQHLLARSFVTEAMEMFDRALRLEPVAREYLMLDEADRTLAILLQQRSRAYAHLGRREEADADATTAHRIARELRDPRLLAQTHFEMGSLYRRKTDLKSAEEHFRQAKRLSEQVGDTALRAAAMKRIAAQRWGQGDLDGAKAYWVEVLSTDDQRARAAGFSGLGLLNICRGQSADARKYLEQAVQAYEQIGAIQEAVYTRVNLIELYHLTGNLRRAMANADRALAESREVHLQEGIAVSLRYRSLVLVDLGRLDEAENHAEDALQMFRDLDTREEELGCYFSLARVAFNRSEPLHAAVWLHRAYTLLDRYDVEGLAPIIHAWRARIYALRGDAAGVQTTLDAARQSQGRSWPLYTSRVDLIAARALMDLEAWPQARTHAVAALNTAESAGYRLYVFRAHLLLSRMLDDPSSADHHRRIADALGRSLAASLAHQDQERFLAFHNGDCAGF